MSSSTYKNKQKSLTKSNTSNNTNNTINNNNTTQAITKQIHNTNVNPNINPNTIIITNRLSTSAKSKQMSKSKNKSTSKSKLKSQSKSKNNYARNLSKTLNFQQNNNNLNSKEKVRNNMKLRYGCFDNKPKQNKNNIKQETNKSKNIPDKKHVKNEQQLLKQQYQISAQKVFNILDIFSRGTISEANISRWVPQAALYFLGSVFQKIRNCRITMTLKQFLEQCIKIYEKSSQQDIKQFIENIRKYKNLNDQKVSLDGQHKQTIQSHVQDRLSFPLQGGQTSFRRVSLAQKTMPLQTIKTCQDNLNNQNIGTTSQIYKLNQEKQVISSSDKKSCLFNQKIQQNKKNQKVKVTPLQNLNQFENMLIQRNRHRKIVDIQNLPLKITQNMNKLPHKQNAKTNNNFLQIKNQSPYFQQNIISNVIAKAVSNHSKRRRQNLNSDRIDKLSMRLQDYIKQNAARIERSKNCRIQL